MSDARRSMFYLSGISTTDNSFTRDIIYDVKNLQGLLIRNVYSKLNLDLESM